MIYIEFDWSTPIRLARQIVQERLSSLQEVLPAEIRPQMTPPSSIMGQIVIAGIYRQKVPRGGPLAVLGNSGRMIEIVGEEDHAASEFQVWEVMDRGRPETWKAVPSEFSRGRLNSVVP